MGRNHGGASGTSLRRRRLTLAPSTRKALQGSSPSTVDVGDDDEGDRRRQAEGRAALSQAGELAVDATIRPKPVHGVAAIPYRFWSQPDANDDDEDDSSEDEELPSTPAFVAAATEAGCSVQQLCRAERALIAGKESSPVGVNLARSIVQSLVQSKLSRRPWKVLYLLLGSHRRGC